MQLLGDLDTLSFAGINQLNWTGHVNRMDSTGTASQVFNSNPRVSRLTGCPETRWWKQKSVYQTNINGCNIKTWKERSKNRSDCERPIKEARGHNGI
jgi:hypothetical protein